MVNKKSILSEDVFSKDPYIKAIQEQIMAEIDRRIADGRLDVNRQMTPDEFQDVERTARENVDRDYKHTAEQ
jgi:hypothetical protein